MAYATVTDLEARWRALSADEQARAGVLLGDAAVILDAQCPPDADPTSDVEARKIVSCGMVQRAMSVGADSVGVTSVQMGAGPYQETRQFSNPTGDLYLTRADKRMLKCGSAVAFTIPVVNDSEYEPWGDS